ncbi:acyl carrier protein [Streptomyces sp. SM11]|uniref:acyl carrier protein n=1 Tax=Streptomyces sp. SM11 TaxID=565557 RepID=UPI0015E19398|nr:phosphopantetheine-binding protein [Streptomyces sp. SM11]
MTRDEALAELAPLIGELTTAPVDDIGPEHHLENDLQLDSLSQMDLVGSVERHFSVKVQDEEIAGLDTVGDLIDLVVTKL